jgi:hypothetical protein
VKNLAGHIQILGLVSLKRGRSEPLVIKAERSYSTIKTTLLLE